jgi:hypothetical protein
MKICQKKELMMKRFLVVALMGALLGGCDRGVAEVGQAPKGEAPDVVPATLILPAAPDGAQDLAVVKQSAQPGDRVVIRGVIGGRAQPFADNRAVFMLIDSSVATCDRIAGDGCKTPWDACCEDPDLIKQKSATVQVVDDKGQPLKAGLSGVGGISPNRSIIVEGTVREGSDAQNLIIDAQGIHVQG